jgi:hypothetical protein
MIRGDSAVCGTTTTGTGTLTLAACPSPPGGVDFDVLLRAMGFGNNNVQVVSYTIIEYTDATFGTAKAHEKGFGTLTLGSSAGIANCTLARTLKQSTATSLNSQPATQNILPGTGITIGTAANTLVFMGPSVADISVTSPLYDAGSSPNGLCAPSTINGTTGQNCPANTHLYTFFEWRIPLLAKRCSFGMWGGYTGTTYAYAALYAIGMDGKPGRLLIDFGLLGVAGSSLNVGFTHTSSAVHPTGFLMLPGEYCIDFIYSVSPPYDGTVMVSGGGAYVQSGRSGTWNGVPYALMKSDTSGPLTPAPDPAYISGYGAGPGNLSNLMFLIGAS